MQQPNAPDLSQVRELPPFSLDASKPYVWALLTVAALVVSRIIWGIINNRGARPSIAAPPRCRVCDVGRMLPGTAVRYRFTTQVIAALAVAAAGLVLGAGLLYGALAFLDLLATTAEAGLPALVAEWRIGNALLICGVAAVVIALSGSVLLDRRVLACDACGACVDRA